MTQNDIAAICGTSQSTVSRVINKNKEPQIPVALAVD